VSLKSKLVTGAIDALENAIEQFAVKTGEKKVAKAATPAAKRVARVETKPAAKADFAVARKAPNIIKRVSGAEKRAPSRAGFSREEAAQRYPQVGEPVIKINEKGKPYNAKGPSAEGTALSKEMARVTSEMKDEGYTPFFNPEDRYYVNPADYPLVGDTLDVVPATQPTFDKYEALANDPDAVARLLAAYDLGSEYPGAKQWYATGQLEDAFKQGLGADEGRSMYKKRFADAMAATTGGMDPDANFRLAHYMNYLAKNGEPTPIASWELPYPIGGGKYGVMPNVAQYEGIINRGGGLTVANPKRFNFSGDFLGHLDRATLDEQMLGAWDEKMKSPPSGTYGVYQRALNKLASQLGVAPAEAQDVMWAGIKLPKAKPGSYTPRPMIDIVNDAIERTSRLTGLSPDQVVEEGIVKAKRPVFAEGGLAELASKYAD
jgi:hypothetical protein